MSSVLIYGGLAVVLGVALMVVREWRIHVTLPRRPVFKGPTVEAWLDNASRELVIAVGNAGALKRVPYGTVNYSIKPEMHTYKGVETIGGLDQRLVTTLSPNGTVSTTVLPGTAGYDREVVKTTATGRIKLVIEHLDVQQHFFRKWSGAPGYAQTGRTIVDTVLPPDESEALGRWLRHHRATLCPDIQTLRKTWDTTCAELLTACRRQRHGSGRAAVEAHRFDETGGIHYLCIEGDGIAWVAEGDAPLLVQHSGDLTGTASGLQAVMPSGRREVFVLTDKDLLALRSLQRKGLAAVA